MLKAMSFGVRAEEALVRELAALPRLSNLDARLVAAQIARVRWVLISENAMRLSQGQSSDMVYPEAVLNAERAFDMLERGLQALVVM